MFPYCRMPFHITALYIYTVINLIVLLHITLVNADIKVKSPDGDIVDNFDDDEAPFAAALTDLITGFIIEANPPDACTKIDGPEFFTNSTIFKKIVLINATESTSRNCSNQSKVRNAEKAGFQAVVMFQVFSSKFFFINGPKPSIPAVIVSYEDGAEIKNNYQYNNRTTENFILEIIPRSQDYNYYVMLFAVVVGVCFIVMLLFLICLLIKCIQERRRSRRNRLSSRQIKQIPTTKYAKGTWNMRTLHRDYSRDVLAQEFQRYNLDIPGLQETRWTGKGDQFDVCAICLEDYNEGDKLRILPCSHAYHAKCIDPWLMNNRRNCPLCKQKVTFGDSSSESDTDSELTSPAENTPLLHSPSNRGPTWGTFTAPAVNHLNEEGIMQPHSSGYSETSGQSCNSQKTVEAELHQTSDDETNDHLPSSYCSVNYGEQELPQSLLADSDFSTDTEETATTGTHELVV